MPSLSHQKEKLARLKAKLYQDEQRLKTLERKKRTRRLIELGGLIAKVELDDLNNNTLFGALLSLKHDRRNEHTLTAWTQAGADAFEQLKAPDTEKQAFIITFAKEPPREIKSQLRDLNFKWNQFRKEWYGYGDSQTLTPILTSAGGTLLPCDPAD